MAGKPREQAVAQQLEVAADERELVSVRDFVSQACAELGFGGRALANIRLAVDEACTNAIRHAYRGRPGVLRIEVAARRGWLVVRIFDQGERFDGRVDMPQLRNLIDQRRRGGLGVFLMHRLMDDVRYQTTPAGNEWILRKRLPHDEAGLAQRMRTTYGARVAVGLVLLTLAVCVPLWMREGRARMQADEQALRALGFGVAEAARPVLVHRAELSPEQTHLFEAVQSLGRQEPRLLAVTVVDRDGMIWASDRTAATFTRFLPPVMLGLPDAAGVRDGRERIDGEPVLHLAVPVGLAASSAELGSVHLSMRWGETAAAIAAARWRVAIIALLVDVAALAALTLFLSRFLAPLQRLLDGVRSLGQGESELEVDGPQEIGAIAAAFNEVNSRYRAARESAAEHARLQEEMQTAREIQASILPQELPEIPGFEIARLYCPAHEVGGDYYDFLPVGEGLTGVVVADVAGKGVPASLVMSMVRTALRMETRGNASAGDVLARLHSFVAADMRKGMFVTMLYAVLDSRNRVVSYASAGHTPLLLYRARTDETFFLNPRGLPVGLAGSDAGTFARNLDVERLRLHPGDLLLLYTDGITEARNASGEEYGEARLAAALKRWGQAPAADFLSELEAEVRRFTADGALQDDLTLVAIKEKAAVAVAAGNLEQQIFDLVETQHVPVVAACRQLGVSPSTYYRWQRERHADDVELQHLSVEKQGCLQRLVSAHPEWGTRELANALREPAWGGFEVPPTLLHAELRALRTGVMAPAAASPLAAPPDATPMPGGGVAVAAPCEAAPAEARRPAPGDFFLQQGALRGLVAPPSITAGTAVLDLEGCLDSGSCEAFERLLRGAVSTAPRLVVDLTHVSYISSRNWGLLAATSAELRTRGELVLCGMRAETRDVYQMLGFETVLRSFADREAALTALADGTAAAPDAAAEERAAVIPVPDPAATAAIGAHFAAAGAAGCEAVDSALQIDIATVGDDLPVTIVELRGVLDTVSASRLVSVMDALRQDGVRRVLADLSRLEFVSSSGWGTLTAAVAALRGVDGDLRLFGMSERLEHIFELLNLRAVLRSFDVLADAVASFALAGSPEDASPVEAPAASAAELESPPRVSTADALAEQPEADARAAAAAGADASNDTEDDTAAAPAEAVLAPMTPALALSPGTGVAAPAASIECEHFAAQYEPFGRSGGAAWLRLHGAIEEAAAARLEAWLVTQPTVPLLLVDSAGIESAAPAFWRALLRHAERLELQGCEMRVVGSRAEIAPPRGLGLAMHVSVAAALRAHQRRRAPGLAAVRLPDAEFDRDAEVRREGWSAYLALLGEASKEDAL